jgi:hypothetical protein
MDNRCARELEEEAFGCRDVSVYALLDDHHSIDHIMFQQARRKNSEQPLIHCRNISITGLRQELPLPKAKELMRVELDVQNLNDVVLLTTNENMRYIAQSYGVYCIEPGPGKDLDEIDEEIFCRFSQNREDFFHIPSL